MLQAVLLKVFSVMVQISEATSWSLLAATLQQSVGRVVMTAAIRLLRRNVAMKKILKILTFSNDQ